jgi:uncharacterized protein YjbI with pentapeptide repeats
MRSSTGLVEGGSSIARPATSHPDNDAALRWLSKGGDSSHFGLVNGRVDLRGVDARGADLTLSGGWQSRFEGCGFQNAKMTDWVFSGDAFIFQRPTVYANCDFSRADLRRCAAIDAVLEDCRFDDAKLERMEFRRTRLTRCTFRGRLTNVTFADKFRVKDKGDPDALKDVDFSEAVFSDQTGFQGLNLAGVKFPKTPGHTILSPWEPTLRCAMAKLESETEWRLVDARVMLSVYADLAGPRQLRGVVTHSDLSSDGKAKVEDVIEVLRACEAECRTAGHAWSES